MKCLPDQRVRSFQSLVVGKTEIIVFQFAKKLFERAFTIIIMVAAISFVVLRLVHNRFIVTHVTSKLDVEKYNKNISGTLG